LLLLLSLSLPLSLALPLPLLLLVLAVAPCQESAALHLASVLGKSLVALRRSKVP
jgi:hypothetical protein